MKQRRAAELVNAGSIRIGTLSDFRREEDHATGIGDAGEGTISNISGPSWTPTGDVNIPDLQLVGIPPGQGPTFKNIGFRGQSEALILCLAGDLKAGGFPPDYDTIVEIPDAQLFVDAVTRALQRAGHDLTFVSLKRCLYAARENRLDHSTTSGEWYRKPPQFADQMEYRAAWSPVGAPGQAISPITLADRELCRLVRMYPRRSSSR
jgi:hypothetical protein